MRATRAEIWAATKDAGPALLMAAVVVLFIITYVPSMTSVVWKLFI